MGIQRAVKWLRTVSLWIVLYLAQKHVLTVILLVAPIDTDRVPVGIQVATVVGLVVSSTLLVRPLERALPMMSPRTVMLAMAAFAVTAGAAITLVGIDDESGTSWILIGLGGSTTVLGLAVALVAIARFGPRRRLAPHLRPARQPRTTPFTLTLRDARRVTALAVFPGGYVAPRRTDPRFDARDVVAVSLSTPEELEEERVRQQSAGRELRSKRLSR